MSKSNRKPTTNQEFWMMTVMYYGGAATFGFGVGSLCIGLGLAVSIHGYLLWKRSISYVE